MSQEQLSLGVEPPSQPRLGASRPPLPVGYREAKSWHELLEGETKEYEYNRQTGGYEHVRTLPLHIIVVYGIDSWREVEKVCKRPLKNQTEYYCVLKEDGCAWPAERRECYAVREEDHE